jgi:hypothetical protein
MLSLVFIPMALVRKKGRMEEQRKDNAEEELDLDRSTSRHPTSATASTGNVSLLVDSRRDISSRRHGAFLVHHVICN